MTKHRIIKIKFNIKFYEIYINNIIYHIFQTIININNIKKIFFFLSVKIKIILFIVTFLINK